jgi:hypothetical protein
VEEAVNESQSGTRSRHQDVCEPTSVIETGTSLLVDGVKVACQEVDWNEKHNKIHVARVKSSQSPMQSTGMCEFQKLGIERNRVVYAKVWSSHWYQHVCYSQWSKNDFDVPESLVSPYGDRMC